MNKRLIILRKKLNLTQSEFAQRIKISRSHLSGLENSTRNFTERVLCDIIREFSVRREWLELGSGDIFENPLESLPDFDKATPEVQKFMKLFNQLDPIVQAYYYKKIEDEVSQLKKRED